MPAPRIRGCTASARNPAQRAAVRWARWSRGAVEAWETTEQPDVEWAVETMLRAAREPEDD
jgi:hypothetical protein